jgi:hypothetical protein
MNTHKNYSLNSGAITAKIYLPLTGLAAQSFSLVAGCTDFDTLKVLNHGFLNILLKASNDCKTKL